MNTRSFLALAPAALLFAVGCASASPDEGPFDSAGPGTIHRVAGNGAQAYNGDGMAPTETAFNLPSAVHQGPDGQLYIMDFNNMRLRCRLSAGTVDTLVGSGEHALAMEGANALESPLENPIDFGFDQQGRLMFVSLHDPRVLRVETDGTLSVVAGGVDVGDSGDGGPALSARFAQLTAMVVAPDGSIFVSDYEHERVRVIRPDGTVQAYAGTGERGSDGDGGPATEATLFRPEGLDLDAEGNLYIADTFNQRIRRVDAKTGIITTVAGSGELGFSGDGGPATAAAFQWPNGVAVADDGQIYIADTFNNRIRRVDLDGVITTIAGSEEGSSGDEGPAIDARLKGPSYLDVVGDDLYFADMQNQVVRMIRLPAP